MAGYLGYALQAGVQSFQTGMNLAQKKSEMKWQKRQQKKLEEMEAKLEEEATLYNSVVTQAGADGFYSEDDMMKINTTYLALGYRTQESLKGAHNALLTMDKAAFDKEMGWFERTTELLESGLLDPKDATAVFEYGRNNWATSEKVQNLYDAADNIYAKTHGKIQEERTWEKAGIIPSERRVPFIEEELGIEMPEAEVTPREPTFSEKRFNWKIEQYNQGRITFDQLLKGEGMYITPEKATGLEKQIRDMRTEGERAGIEPAKINKAIQDKILGKPTPEPEPKPETVTTLKNWEAMFDIFAVEGPRTEEEYNRALELLRQSEDKYTPKYPTWKEALIAETKGIGKDLERETDRTDRKTLLDLYKRKLEEIKAKYPDVDLNQFTKPKEMGNLDKFLEWVGF